MIRYAFKKSKYEWVMHFLKFTYTGCKVKSGGGLFLCNRWSQTYTSSYKIGLKNVKIYVMAFLNFKNRFCDKYKN